MVSAKRLLSDLKRLRKRLEDDLRDHHAASRHRIAVQAEWQDARDTKRTADTFESFFSATVDQGAVHWILAVVFIRFLEDNRLIDQPVMSGPGERMELAQIRQRDYFRANPTDSDAEYLLSVFAELARLPGMEGLLEPAHNPLFRLPISGDGARELINFFRRRTADTDELEHDFTDEAWETRFLGDLYQDLSEDARKRYALLQTPDFVEEWILSRTLDPAIREFGHEQVRMIDPTCGSGHFLLGGFTRLLEEWRRHAPDMPPAAQAQKALDGVAGVDLNPFAVEIARFRLLIAALRASEQTRLSAAPDFRIHLATGDSLLHGRHFARRELGGTEEGFRRVLRHHYVAENTGLVDAILGRQYHAVVGNPPYITPKDAAMRDAYREIYESCHMKYGLGAPFTERFFDLALQGTRDQSAGFVGLIVANSFMKREFGKKLIEEVLPSLDLTHVVDCSGAYIPGHGTPTVILFGRNRAPVASTVRTVRGVRGEPVAPDNPASGMVWSAILAQTDLASSDSAFISSEDTAREDLRHHPWNMGGGGAAEVQELIEADRSRLESVASAIGVFGMTNADEIMLAHASDFKRAGCETFAFRSLVLGDAVRDWRVTKGESAVFPYNPPHLCSLKEMPKMARWLWPARTTLGNRATFNKQTYFAEDRAWWGWHQIAMDRIASLIITFGEVATHNHFVLDRGGNVFKQTAPVIKLPATASQDDYLGLLGLLNSSVACFWLKQVCHNKGDSTDAEGARTTGTDLWINTYQFNATRVGQFPLAANQPLKLAQAIDYNTQNLSSVLPQAVCSEAVPTRTSIDQARDIFAACRHRLIALQEELDWRCYGLYDIIQEPLEHSDPPLLSLGERAFEIVMARRIAAGELETAWFERHRSTPITELPDHWPADYRAIVERRIALIETDPTIGLIERPEYKRRWSITPWEEMVRDALRAWLLERLEEPRYWPVGEARIVSARGLADAAQRDSDFMSVAELYVGRSGFDHEALVAELVQGEAVPFLAALRYTDAGLRKRADWEATWELQRAEDVIDASVEARRPEFVREAWMRRNPTSDDESSEAYAVRMAVQSQSEDVSRAADSLIAAEQKRRKAEEIGDIPVPPKYRTPDFQSATYWRLRGGLDVPKERFVSYPHSARDADTSLPILWAGYDHRARAQALAALYVERKEHDGWPAERLKPMLAGLLELVPWLKQWHNDIDADTGLRLGDYFEGFINEEARELGLTLADLRSWRPPAPVRRSRTRRSA